MSSSRQLCRRVPTTSITTAFRASGEPLLFLYPRWFSDAAPRLHPSPVPLDSGRESSTTTSRPIKAKAGHLKTRHAREERGHETHVAVKSTARALYQLRDVKFDDWRVTLEDLEQNTPQGTAENQEISELMTVPDGHKARFLQNIGETLLDFKLRTGCRLHRLGGEDERHRFQSFVLSGPPDSVEEAKEVILEYLEIESKDIASDYRARRPSPTIAFKHALESTDNPVRAVWYRRRSRPATQRADDIPLPRSWSVISLANYIENLTEPTMPRLVQKQLYGPERSHVEVVTDLIERLFDDPAVEQYISVRCLNAALSFLVKHSNVGLARTLMLKTDRLNIRIASESFNILLRGAAVARDLFNYNLILQMMIKRKITPNAGTWTALIMTMKPLEIRMHILRRMQDKGLLFSPRAMKGVAEHIIEEGAPTFFSTGRSASQYITQLDELFGRPAWMNESGANRMVDVLGAQGRMEEAKQVLSTLYTRGYLPKVETLNTFLIHCTRHNNERAAIQLLAFLKQQGRMPLLDERSFEILFKLAWNGKRYNMTRVVWRYACIWGRATRHMQQYVVESIKRDVTDLDTLPVLQKWKATAGKIAAGIPPITMYDPVEDIYEADALSKNPPTDTVQLMQRLAQALGPDEEDAGAQMRRRKLAKHIVHEDMKVVPRWKSRRGFTDMLAEAFEMDREWSHGGKRSGTSTEWKIEHAIVVPVWDGLDTE